MADGLLVSYGGGGFMWLMDCWCHTVSSLSCSVLRSLILFYIDFFFFLLLILFSIINS